MVKVLERLAGAALLAGLVIALLAAQATAAGPPWGSPTNPVPGDNGTARSHFLGVAPTITKAQAAPMSATNLSYHGGPVMRTNRIHPIFWLPSGESMASGYQTLISSYLQNVATASGRPDNVYYSDSQYSDTTGPIQYSSTVATPIVDTTAMPANGCNASGNGFDWTTRCITDAQLLNEVNSVVNAQGLPRGTSDLYVMFTPKNVGSCYGTDINASCAYSDYCAYHSWFYTGTSTPTLYANMPYEAQANDCGFNTPNGNVDADIEINTLSHEQNEAITDPIGTGWWDSTLGLAGENGDKCNFNFGDALGATAFGDYNQLINGGKYWLQQEWSNEANACVQRSAPAIASFTPASGAAGSATVTINGSNYATVSSVKFNGAAASFTVLSAKQIRATVPAGATNGAITVATSAGTATSATPFVTQPQVISVSPAAGATGVATSTRVVAAFNDAMDHTTTQAAFSLKRTSDGAVVAGAFSWFGNALIFTPSAALAAGTQYTATETTAAKDANGLALSVAKSWSFTTTGGTPPTITAVSPADNGTEVYPNAGVYTFFSRAMDHASAQAAFSLKRTSDGAAVAGAFSWFGNVLIFTPSHDLQAGVQYTAAESTGARASDGIALAAGKTWHFTTTTRPVIEQVSPVNGATGVKTSAVVYPVFSEAMDHASVQAAFSLKRTSDGAAVAGSIAWFGNVAIFVPSSALAPGTQYTAAVTGGARDLSGQTVINPTTWKFTTGAAGTQAAAPRAANVRVGSSAVPHPLSASARALATRITGLSLAR